MNKRYDSILDTIGNTPVVRINKLGPSHVNVYVKVESFNPMGSIKDRLALGVIEDAERRGELRPGQTIVEATSGNTGIGLAMVCAQKGYPLVVTMAENFSVERRKLMRFLGAKVVLTPAPLKGTGMVDKARELAQQHGWWQSRQFENPANAAVHERTTGREIIEAFADTTLDYWVTGFGTGGTLSGVSRALRARSPKTRVVVCEPDNSPLLGSGIPQKRNPDGSHSESHPAFRPHLMQGWSPDFLPGLIDEVVDGGRIDIFMPIDGNEALKAARDLASKEGIFVGISAGATFAGALRLAEDAPEGCNILCMLPDTGERYLSTPLFDNVSADMDASEMAISRSTEGYRFDMSSAAAPLAPAAPSPAALEEFHSLLGRDAKTVVMFALEWCEFCWSVRKAFARLGIDYRSVDLDSVAYQADDRGGKLREALRSHTGSNTFPQIFVNGQFVGGCTDVFDAVNDGSFQQRLEANGIPFEVVAGFNPYHLLPTWLHPR